MKSIRKPPKRKVLASGGPWADCLLLIDGGTMVFRVGEWRGKYNERGIWHAV